MALERRGSLVVVVLAALGIAFPVAFATGGAGRKEDSPRKEAPAEVKGAEPTQAEAEAKKKEEACERRFLQPLLDHFGVASLDPAKHVVDEYLIAAVPDPIDSGNRYYFDRWFEGIGRGLESLGYLPDRFWIPWYDVQASAKDREEIGECRKSVPGVVLFRGRSQPPAPAPLVALLLVGEAPTWGVHKAALSHALGFMACRPGWGDEVEILGPAFSGGASSLLRAIDDWYLDGPRPCDHPEPRGKVHVVSGSATSPHVGRLLDRRVPPTPSRPTLRFEATVIPNDVRRCAFYRYLRDDLGVRQVERREPVDGAGGPTATVSVLEGVVLFSESTTEYGRPASSAASDCPEPSRRLRFPPHLGAVRVARSEWESRRPVEIPHPMSRKTEDPAAHLPFSLVQAGESREGVPDLSPHSAVAHEKILSSAVREFSALEVSYIGLVATDVFDMIFLAKRIRELAPGVRLFIFGNEVLSTHPAYADALRGTILVSSYPPLGPGRAWSDDDPETQFFASDSSQGVYNAVQALLSDGPPGRSTLRGYSPFEGSLEHSFNLPIWISVIGNGGTFPMAVKRYAQAGTQVFSKSDDTSAEPPEVQLLRVGDAIDASLLWHITYLVVTSLCIYVGYRCWVVRGQGDAKSGLSGSAASLRMFRRCACEPGASDQPPYLLLCLTALALLQGYLLWFDSVLLFHEKRTSQAVMLFIEVMLSLLSVALLLTNVVRVVTTMSWRRGLRRAPSAPRFSAPRAYVVVLMIALIPVLLTLWLARMSVPLHEATSGSTLALGALLLSIPSCAVVFRGFGRQRRAGRGGGAAAAPDDVEAGACPGAAPRSEKAHAPERPQTLVDDLSWWFVTGGALLLPLLAAGLVWFEIFSRRAGPTFFVDQAIYVQRVVHLSSGVSPAVPFIVGTAIICLWCGCNLTRLWLLDNFCTLHSGVGSMPISRALGRGAPRDIHRYEKDVTSTLQYVGRTGRYIAVLTGLAALVAMFFYARPLITLEGRLGSWALLIVPVVGVFVTAQTAVRLYFFWRGLHIFLRRLARHPIASAFDRLPSVVAKSPEAQISGEIPIVADLATPLQQLRVLCATAAVLGRGGPLVRPSDWQGRVEPSKFDIEVEERLRSELERPLRLRDEEAPSADVSGASPPQGAGCVAELLVTQAGYIADILDRYWHPSRGFTLNADVVLSPKDRSRPLALDSLDAYDKTALPARARAWLRLGEELVATVIASILARTIRHFRHFLTMLVGGTLLLLLLVSSYAFQPRVILLNFISLAIVLNVIVAFYVFIQLDQNEVLSRIARKEQGHSLLNREIVLRFFTWGVLPIVSVIAVQFPDVAESMFSWADPILKVMR